MMFVSKQNYNERNRGKLFWLKSCIVCDIANATETHIPWHHIDGQWVLWLRRFEKSISWSPHKSVFYFDTRSPFYFDLVLTKKGIRAIRNGHLRLNPE